LDSTINFSNSCFMCNYTVTKFMKFKTRATQFIDYTDLHHCKVLTFCILSKIFP
jgi:hypothetical protein